jgi:hypothetical protein
VLPDAAELLHEHRRGCVQHLRFALHRLGLHRSVRDEISQRRRRVSRGFELSFRVVWARVRVRRESARLGVHGLREGPML